MNNVSGLLVIAVGSLIAIIGIKGNQRQLLPQIFGNFVPNATETGPTSTVSMVNTVNL